jgi:serine-type D-Ala-D-Ala carboxypeptidase/endopeptidase (penicillin-binding protein 4)
MKSCTFRSFVLLSFSLFALLPGPLFAGKSRKKTFREIRSETPGNPIHQGKLKKIINGILPEGKKDIDQGIIVSSMQTGEVLFERNADQLLVPASVNKVLTSYAALKKLKPNGTFKTTVFITGVLKEGRLAGDLYLKGGGDPSLVSERMWMLVNELRRSGIKSVTGNIVVDPTYFDEEKTPDSRPKYLKDQAYNAPVGALSFNFNTTTVYVRPGEQPGMPPTVYTDPANSYIDIVNQGKTGPAGSKNTLAANRTEYVKGDIGDTVLLRGTIPVDHAELRFYRNIVNPALYTGHMFKTFMDELGIKAAGNVVEGSVPSDAKEILEFDSQPMWQVVWGMNKFSNNFVADQVMKKLGAESWGAPGTMTKGLAALQDSLEDIGISRKDYQVSDGSGLTRATKLTARQVLRVLSAAYHDMSVSSEFMASLGIAGEDGTLKRRFPSSNGNFILRAKTGTLDGVSALAGYVTSEDKENMGFVIILNDPKLKYGKMTTWVDQIALAISRFSRK